MGGIYRQRDGNQAQGDGRYMPPQPHEDHIAATIGVDRECACYLVGDVGQGLKALGTIPQYAK